MRKIWIWLAFILVVATLQLQAHAAPKKLELGAGESILWSGPLIETSTGTESFKYKLEVTEPGKRLRIGFDHPQVGDSFTVSIGRPGGGTTTTFGVGPGIYSDEVLFDGPAVGTWRIEVTADDVTDSAFRLRAKLEERLPSLGTRKGQLLPNLQIIPPHDSSFLFPVTNGAGDMDPTGVDLAGREGCHPEEHAEDHAIRCLRFGFGVRNTGVGPMDLFYEGSDPMVRELFQRVYWGDHRVTERKAGKAAYHKTHAHFHHDAAVGLQLFRVTDEEKGTLEPAGEKRTKGFAHRNELLRDWDTFYPTVDMFPNLGFDSFGLRPGWADIYEWDRPGNYVDFGLNPDGLYVLRMRADPVDGILEMNERDNLAYTYLRVEGSEVEELEAGRGRDPWDRCKILVGLGGFPDPAQRPRPAGCPPDTT